MKYAADRLLRQGGRTLLPQWMVAGGTRSVCGDTFLRRCIPFLLAVGEERFAARVPTRWVMGWSWKRDAKSAPAVELPGLLSYLLADERADRARMDHASLSWWPALGIVLATEGKNRVELLRRMRADTIPGEIAVAPYPKAESIRLYAVGPTGEEETWAVLDGRLVQRLPGYRLSEGLLRAYGIPGPDAWPRSYPPPSTVHAALFERDDRLVDLDALVEPEPTAERIPFALASLPSVRWRTERILVAGASLTVASLASFALHWWPVALGLFGLLNGALGAALLPWFTVKKSVLDHT